MPYRQTQLCNNEIYHVIVRRIEGNLLFVDTDDYFRGIFSLYEFNDARPVEIKKRREDRKQGKQEGDPVSFSDNDNREKLVEILAFCLMPNHLHLLLKQIADNGITKFMNKFGAGYPAYFRRKHTETGSPSPVNKGYFFQGRFVSVHMENDTQLKTVFAYIHTNPISLVEAGWKERKVNDFQKASEFIKNYKWSSYGDYLGIKNFPSLINKDLMLKIMGGQKECESFADDWINFKGK